MIILNFFLFLGIYLNPIDTIEISDIIVSLSGDKGAREYLAVELYKKGYSKKVLFCGHGTPSKKYISNKYNININDILIEQGSKNTKQNAIHCSKIIKDNNAKKIILITSGFHQRRSFMYFKKYFDGDIINISTNDYNWNRIFWWFDLSNRKFAINELSKIIFGIYIDKI